MAQTIEAMLETILRHEGGYVDDAADRGGATNMGITQQTLSAWRGRPVTKEEVRALTREEAKAVYRSQYFFGPRIDFLAVPVQPLAFDMCVNHGPGGAVRIIQTALQNLGYPCGVDGGIGPNTCSCLEKAIADHGWEVVNNRIVEERVAFYQSLVEQNASQRRFLRGWLKRAKSFRV